VATVSIGAMVAFLVVAAQRLGYPYELQWFEGSTVEVSAWVTEGPAARRASVDRVHPGAFPAAVLLGHRAVAVALR